MKFAYPWVFLLLLVIPLLHFWWVKRNKPARVRFPIAMPASLKSRHPIVLLLAIKYLALAFAIAALARPQTSFTQTERQVSGIDIILVMDVSASMLVEDMGKENRLEIAKRTMEDFIRGRENDRIGFVIFSGEPLTLAPPTLDYGILTKAVRDIETGILKDGTAIGDGLSMAVNRLRNSKAKSRIVVLLTDGDNNVGQVDPATAGDLAAGYGIKVYTIAIGREGRVKVPIRNRGMLGQPVVSYQWMDNALNPELLQKISKMTDARFYRVEDERSLDQVFAEINRLEKTEIKSNEKVRYDERFARPLIAALLLLLLERLISRWWWRVLP